MTTTERREPTISGIRPEKDEIAARHQARGTGPNAAAAQRAVQGARPVVVKSSMAPVALLFALIGIALAGYAYWQLMESQKALAAAEERIVQLENRFELSDGEATASLEVLQAKVRENESEVRKLWDTRNVNRKGIADNQEAVAAMSKTVNGIDSKISAAVKGATSEIKSEVSGIESEVKLANELVEAQQGALVSLENKNAELQKRIQALTDQLKQLESAEKTLQGRVQTNEQAIEAIDAFRRTVNQELLRLRSGA